MAAKCEIFITCSKKPRAKPKYDCQTWNILGMVYLVMLFMLHDNAIYYANIITLSYIATT